MSDHQDDTTPLEYFIAGLVTLLFGLLYFFINYGPGFWPGSADQEILTAAPVEEIATKGNYEVAQAQTTEAEVKKPEQKNAGEYEAELAWKQAEIDRLKAEEAVRKRAEKKRLAAEEAARKQAETDRLLAEEAARKRAETEKLLAEEALRKQAELGRLKAQQALKKEPEQGRLEYKLPDGTEIMVPDQGFEGAIKNAMVKRNINEPHIFDGISFESGSARLNTASQNQIKSVAALMNTYKDIKILIRGHTDNTGTLNANSLLSLTRSDSMKKELTELGIAQERIKIEGVGQLEPIASNDTEAGKSQNRRIELILIE